MAEKNSELVNHLLTGQNKLETDVSELKKGQERLETDVSVLKTDFAELKEGQRRIELIILNMENRIVPIINATYEGMKLLTEQMASFLGNQIEHSEKLENHELRILKLEHTK